MASEPISEHLISNNFLGVHASQIPLVLYAYAYIYTYTDLCYPLLKILATGLEMSNFMYMGHMENYIFICPVAQLQGFPLPHIQSCELDVW